jgi:hypothetical protein
MKRPEAVTLSREEGEALIERIECNTLSAEDRRVLGKVLTCYFWVLFAVREAKLSLTRLKALVFGEKPKKPQAPSAGGATGGSRPDEGGPSTTAAQEGSSAAASRSPQQKVPPSGHGRYGAEV